MLSFLSMTYGEKPLFYGKKAIVEHYATETLPGTRAHVPLRPAFR